jgi:hypothetical protein
VGFGEKANFIPDGHHTEGNMATRQSGLFGGPCAEVRSRQLELIELDGHGRESDLSCDQCGAAMVETASGYLCCPNGHGKLNLDGQRQSTPFGWDAV